MLLLVCWENKVIFAKYQATTKGTYVEELPVDAGFGSLTRVI